MPQSSTTDFAEQYAVIDDDALLRLSAQPSQLVREAQVALAAELQRRSLTVNENEQRDDDAARFCTRCGQPLGNPGGCAHCSLPLAASPSGNGNAEPRGAGLGGYVGLVTLLTLITASMSVTAFVLFSSFGKAPDAPGKAGEDIGKQLLPWVVMIVWARSIWKGILAREQDVAFKQRHRRFTLVAGLVFIGLLGVGVGSGIWNAGRIERANRIRAIAAANADIREKGQDFARRLGELRSRETPTFRDYYQQCVEVEELLNEAAPTRERAKRMLLEIRNAAGNDQKAAVMLNGVDALLQKDDEVLSLLRREIAESRKLMTLPPSAQSDYYASKIIPLQREEQRLADEEAIIQQRLRDSGVNVPPID